MSKEISVLPPQEKAMTVFTTEKGLDPYLKHIREEIDSFLPNIETKKGRDEVASMAYKVAQSKTALDKLGLKLVTDLKEKPKLIDKERKRVRDLLDSWRDEVRKPLNDWEEKEKSRVDALQSDIALIQNTATNQYEDGSRIDSIILRSNLSNVESVKMGDHWQEFEAQAARAKEDAIEKLKGFIADAEKYEAEQAELERLRKEAAEREENDRIERIRQQAIEDERKAAEAKALQERAKIEREREEERQAIADRERQHQLEIERANREKAESEARALREKEAAEQRQREAVEAERRRIEQQQAFEKAEAEKKAANQAHRQKINRESLEDLKKLGLSEDQSKALIKSIVKNEIRNITVNY